MKRISHGESFTRKEIFQVSFTKKISYNRNVVVKLCVPCCG